MFEDLFCLSTGGYIVNQTIMVCTIWVEGVLRKISVKGFGTEFQRFDLRYCYF